MQPGSSRNDVLRFRVILSLLFFGCFLPAGRCALPRQNPVENSAISLLKWAREHEFRSFWEKDGLLRLTNRSAILFFKLDAPVAEINGVRVWLSEPILLHDGQPCIAPLDLRTTIVPILFPKTNNSVTTICLDPGHGGKDTGGVFGKYIEKQYTLPLAIELAAQLETNGFKVILTRTNDTFVELEKRPELANQQRASLFISLHFNIAQPGEAKGIEVYCLTPAESHSTNTGGKRANRGSLPGNEQDAQNVLLAYELQRSLVTNMGAEDRGLRRARFEVLRSARMPAVLIEGGFLSDPTEGSKIADPKYRAQLAAAIVQGVLVYRSRGNPISAMTWEEIACMPCVRVPSIGSPR